MPRIPTVRFFRRLLPSTGRLTVFHPSAQRNTEVDTVRVDSGVAEGDEISVHYDPLIAKLVTHGLTRSHAIGTMTNALDEFVIDGIRHNIPLLAAIMENKSWRSGELSTDFIARVFPDGFGDRELPYDARTRLVAVAAALDWVENKRRHKLTGQMSGRAMKFAKRRAVRLGRDWYESEVLSEDAGLLRIAHLQPLSGEHTIESEWAPGQRVWFGKVDGVALTVQVGRILNGYRLSHRGSSTLAFVCSERQAALMRLMLEKASRGKGDKLLCPMPGLVVHLAVSEGQQVRAGETMAVVEAMKMQNILRAERDGVVKKLYARAGDSLAVDAVILEFV
jgi:propionyl-CoA carboxylase alpha chain